LRRVRCVPYPATDQIAIDGIHGAAVIGRPLGTSDGAST
jgi:hypothetical protein